MRWLLLLLYAAIVAAVRAHHEPWRDEVEPWVMARDAPWRDLAEACSFSGHPPLWYALNLLLARGAGLPLAAQGVLHTAIAVAMTAVLLLRSPFRLALLLPLVFSPHLLYQYGVVARGYAAMLLLTFLAVAAYRRRLTRPCRYATVLALLYQSEVFAWAFGGALGLFFLADLRRAPTLRRRTRVAAATIVVGGGLLAIASMVRWSGEPGKNDGLRFGPRSLPYAAREAFFPLDAYGPRLKAAFGTPAARAAAALPRLPFALAAVAILGASLLALPLRSRPALLLAASLAWLGALFVFKYHGFVWHHALFVPLLAATAWFADADDTPAPPPGRRRRALRTARLLLAVAAAGWPLFAAAAIAWDLGHDYSAGPAAGAYLRPRVSRAEPVVAFGCHGLVAATAQLPPGTVWMALIERRANYTLWDDHMRRCFEEAAADPEWLLRRHAARLARRPGALVLTDFPLADPAGYGLELRWARQGLWESFWVYGVRGTPPIRRGRPAPP